MGGECLWINIIVVLCFSVDRPTVLNLGKFEIFPVLGSTWPDVMGTSGNRILELRFCIMAIR